VGDTMPLEMAKENIKQILISRQRAEVIRRHEERIKNNALSSGHAKIYNQAQTNDLETKN
jgi:hypothetical protein